MKKKNHDILSILFMKSIGIIIDYLLYISIVENQDNIRSALLNLTIHYLNPFPWIFIHFKCKG